METVKEKLAKLLLAFEDCPADRCLACEYQYEHNCGASRFADYLIQNGVTIAEPARPLEEWHEDYGTALWWTFPIEEPPYVGSPLDLDWPGYHTHWTLISPLPQPPKGVQ